jgi:uncharacterized membrane protein
MNKTRLENLSDGVFAIVFTLLVLDIRIPDALEHATSPELYAAIGALGPFFVGYIISFFVLTMFWTSHSFFFTFSSVTSLCPVGPHMSTTCIALK